MRDVLKNKRFIKTHGCSCGGIMKETWQSHMYPGIVVEIRPNAKFFEIFCCRKNSIVTGNDENFETVLGGVLEKLNPKSV
jgi:hypothetical protein